jgi:hypothetical protein
MSRWRWRLFAWMARREFPEDRFLRVPNATTMRRDVRVDMLARVNDERDRAVR